MVHDEPSFQLLYVSELAADCDVGVVKDIVAVSRHRNPARSLTGALLFDGEHFCQLIEGSEADVLALMHSIERDPRHTAVQRLYMGSATKGRLLQRWSSGYCDEHELEALLGADALHGRLALDSFLSVLEGADME